MNFGFQLKLRDDIYSGSYWPGLSLADSVSVKRCEQEACDQDKTVYACERYRVTAHHIHCKGTIQCYSEFENLSQQDVTLDLFASFCLKELQADTIHRATSFWSAEGKLLKQKLTELNMEPSYNGRGARVEKFGQIGSMPVRKFFPFLCLENSRKREFTGIQLYCASSWQMEIISVDKQLKVTGGLADFDYGHWCKVIRPGEKFTTPKAVIATGKTLNEVCDKLTKAQKPDISRVDKDLPVIFNEYCSSWGNPTRESIEKLLPRLKNSGIKYFVIDCGWFCKPDEPCMKYLGDWNVDRVRFPNGIKEITDMIRSYGLIPGIWFEFEKASFQSEMFQKTDYLLYRDGIPLYVGWHRFLDMRKEACHQYLKEKVIDFLRDNGFGYMKIDYNDCIGVGCDGEESLGEGLRKNILGTQRFIREIKQELPDLVIENCASGGHRLEPSMMELCSMASFSDAHECKCIPLIAANVQRMIRAEQSQIWAVIRPQDDIHRIRYSLAAGFLGRLCLSGDITEISERYWNEVLKGIAFYDRCKHIIQKGSTSIIDASTENFNHPVGYQAVLRGYQDEALLVIHTFKGGANPPVEKYLGDYKIIESFGSELNKDFRARVYLLKQ